MLFQDFENLYCDTEPFSSYSFIPLGVFAISCLSTSSDFAAGLQLDLQVKPNFAVLNRIIRFPGIILYIILSFFERFLMNSRYVRCMQDGASKMASEMMSLDFIWQKLVSSWRPSSGLSNQCKLMLLCLNRTREGRGLYPFSLVARCGYESGCASKALKKGDYKPFFRTPRYMYVSSESVSLMSVSINFLHGLTIAKHRPISDGVKFFISLSVRYLAALFTVLQVLRQHPHCSTECCLSVIMMMNDAVEDVLVFEPENDDDQDDQREQEETCDLSNL